MSKGIPLNHHIEGLLEDNSNGLKISVPEGISNSKALSIIGIAKPKEQMHTVEDERLNYILSK